MKRYRIKKSDGHIIGPISLEEVAEFFESDDRVVNYSFHIFPIGDWGPISNFPELVSIKNSSKTKTQEEVEIKLPKVENPDFREFKYDRKNEELVDYEELERKHQENKKQQREAEGPIAEKSVDKTVVVKLGNVQAFEKTRIVKRDDLEEGLTQGQNQENQDESEVVDEIVPVKEIEEKIDLNNKTMIFNISELLPSKIEEVNEIEEKILALEEKAKGSKNKISKSKSKSEEVKASPKKNLSIALFLVFALVFLWPSSEDKKIDKIIRPVIAFPITEAVENEIEAKKNYELGLKEQIKDTYVGTIKASLFFSKSMSHKFRNNEALAPLILTFSELLPEVSSKYEAGKVINQLLTIAGPQVFKNAEVALGAANYYSYFDKEYAAITVLESYLRINKPTVKLYAKYLNLLLDVGDFVKAKVAFQKLVDAPKNDVDVIAAIARYYVANEQVDKAIEVFDKEKDKFKDNMKFLVFYGDLLLKSGNIERLKPLTVILLAEFGGGSPYFQAQALKFMGYIKIANKEFKEVTKFFNASLEIYDSIELKEALATLEIGGDQLTEELISKSKILVLINKAKVEAAALNWDKAFQYAIAASDVMENNLTAKLYLSDLQIRRGYFTAAINTLSKLREKYPLNLRVNYNLVMANLRAFKVDEVRRIVTTFSTVQEFQNSYEYLALLGYYYAATGNSKLAFERFLGALQKNPLRDDYYYEMAKIAYDVKRLKKSREYLAEAMKLDPFNYDYKILFSKLLFDLDDVQTAIGYLRGELEKSPDNPKLIGQIGIFYYQDQNFGEYKVYREKLMRLTTSDEALFEYMVQTSELENDFKGLIDNAERLILIAPGKLDIRMKQANAYYAAKQYKEALSALDGIEERLDSYPKVHFNKAKVYLATEEYRKAELAAKKEIEFNPNSEHGHYILGEIYLKLEMFNDAKKSLEKSLQIKPDFYECLLALGWLKMKQGQAAAARELYLRALRYNENDPEIRKRLGYVYKEIGQSLMAIEQFRIYLDLNPAATDRELIDRIILQLQ